MVDALERYVRIDRCIAEFDASAHLTGLECSDGAVGLFGCGLGVCDRSHRCVDCCLLPIDVRLRGRKRRFEFFDFGQLHLDLDRQRGCFLLNGFSLVSEFVGSGGGRDRGDTGERQYRRGENDNPTFRGTRGEEQKHGERPQVSTRGYCPPLLRVTPVIQMARSTRAPSGIVRGAALSASMAKPAASL